MPGKRKSETECDLAVKCSRVSEVLERGNNALMQLNEIGIKGLKWSIEQINNMFPQRFKASCVFTEPFSGVHEVIPTGVVFTAEGSNKSTCRHEIAYEIMNRLSGKSPLVKNGNQAKAEEEVMVTDVVILPKVVPSVPDIPRMEDAARLLYEKVTDLEYKYTLSADGYCCFVSYKGFMMKGIGSSKKIAKRHVAAQILMKYFKFTFSDDDNPQSASVNSTTSVDTDKLPFNRRKNFSNQVQAMVKNGFEKLVSTLDAQYSKRKVVAGIVISRKMSAVFPDFLASSSSTDSIDPLQFYTKTGWTINPDDEGEVLKLVAISSGTKCMPRSEGSFPDGNVVSDCHAEVIAKRALQFFLQRTIDRLVHNIHSSPGDPLFGSDILSIFDNNNPWIYKLKDDVKFHFYVSCPPCGDSRIFFPQINKIEQLEEENDEELLLDRRNCGLLRTKIECGEGTIPIKTKYIETWDRSLGEDRLATMSCSDKVCVWNVLGLQGALLSNVLSKPIYLDSITIGSVVELNQSQRALYDRAKRVTEHHDWISSTPFGGLHDKSVLLEQGELERVFHAEEGMMDSFRVNCPYILTVTDQDERSPGKASHICGNWILGESSFEVISSSTGLTDTDVGVPSRLSKRRLFMGFLTVFKWMPFICPEDGIVYYREMKKLVSYPDQALGAVNYHRKKRALLSYFENQDLGRWVSKTSDHDWFGLKVVY